MVCDLFCFLLHFGPSLSDFLRTLIEDENRTALLSHSIPQLIINTLQILLPIIASPPSLSLNFRLVRSAFGALMNISLDHPATQRAILELPNGVHALLAVVNELYLPKDWSRRLDADGDDGLSIDERAGVAMWGWKVLGEVALLESEPPVPLPTSVLPLLLPSIFSYLPSSSSSDILSTLSPTSNPSPLPPLHPTSTLLSTDLQILLTAVHLLSTQTALSPAWESCLANLRAVQGEHQDWDFWEGELELWADEVEEDKVGSAKGREVLGLLMDFVESAQISAEGIELEDEEEDEVEGLESQREEWEKSMGEIKGGLVRTIVGVVGNDEVGESLFDNEDVGGGWFVRQLGQWLEIGSSREDLVVCAVLCLGNLARNGEIFVFRLCPSLDLFLD